MPTPQPLIDVSVSPIDQLHAATAVYTSTHIVDQLLDRLPWPGEPGNLLDPAAGDGSFILRALERLNPATNPSSINRIHGWEIHPGAADEARTRIVSFLQQHAFTYTDARRAANRMIVNKDFLTNGPEHGQFRFIAGNPPYLRFQRLPDYFKTLYTNHVPSYARADLLHSFLNSCRNLLPADGMIAIICSDRVLFNANASELRRIIGLTFGISHLERLDAATSFYRPKQRVRNSPPRIHPVALVLAPISTGAFPMSGSAISPDAPGYSEPLGPTLKDIARVAIAPWLGPNGIFVITGDTATQLANQDATLIPAVDTDDIDPNLDTLLPLTRFAIRTFRDQPPVPAVNKHLLAQQARMPKRGQNRPYWIPPEPINLPLDKPSLLIPRIARRIRAIPIPAGVLPINHNLSVVSTTDRSLDDIKTVLTSDASHAWLQRNAARLENGYYSITTTLLRRLPI
jgi:hypothetical protein